MYIIERDNNNFPQAETTPRVYVTGPHFDADVWSSTTDPNEASAFPTIADAEREASRRTWTHVRVVALADAPDLTPAPETVT